MLRYRTVRWLLALIVSSAICWGDYLMQTRLPGEEGVHSAFEDSWWYRAWFWTVPPEGQRGLGFVIDTAFAIGLATIVLYILLTRWQRRVSSRHRV